MGESRYRDKFDTEKVLNLANIITAFRIVLIPFFAEFTLQGRYDLALAVFVLCGVSDAVDGAIARIFRMRSRFGTLLDPVADKAMMATSFIILGMMKKVPLWLVVTVISRDLIVLTGSLFVLIFIGIEGIFVAPSSKINTIVQVTTVGYMLLLLAFPHKIGALSFGEFLHNLKIALFYLCETTAIYSGLKYFVAGFKLLSEI